jgi:6-phosphogluconolactonase
VLDVQVTETPEEAARVGADLIAHAIVAAVSVRAVAAIAISGGDTPWRMFQLLAGQRLPWDAVHVFQVDERMGAPAEERNGDRAREALAASGLSPDHLHLLPAEKADDLDAIAAQYEADLRTVCDGVFDCVHLGLGPDGHTASLVPGDPVLEVRDRLVAPTAAPYQDFRRITLTFPALEQARSIVWLVNGEDRAEILPKLRAGDRSLPAGRVPEERAVLVCDRSAAVRMEDLAEGA